MIPPPYPFQVHEDVYTVVVAAVEEMLSSKTARKALELWNGFVEAFLGLPARKLPTFDDEGEGDQVSLVGCTHKISAAFACHQK